MYPNVYVPAYVNQILGTISHVIGDATQYHVGYQPPFRGHTSYMETWVIRHTNSHQNEWKIGCFHNYSRNFGPSVDWRWISNHISYYPNVIVEVIWKNFEVQLKPINNFIVTQGYFQDHWLSPQTNIRLFSMVYPHSRFSINFLEGHHPIITSSQAP